MRKWLAVAGWVALVFSVGGCAQEKRYTQPSSAMEPTIRAGEKLAADSGAYKRSAPQRGDVVVFRHEGVLEVKRVIALSSDTIQGKDFKIFLNGNLLAESYIQHLANAGTISYSVSYLKDFGSVRVSTGQVFVMGDNRDYSHDSRDPNFGTIPIQDVVGKAVRIVASPEAQRVDTTIR